jgi:GR25 family glycosyltransferase involved in LPS biosynthesis
MTHIEKYISEAWYINLDDRTDRKEHMEKEISKYGLENFVKRYSAIKAIEKTPQNCVKASGTSHRNLIQYAKDNNLNNILILEDDVFFKEENYQFLEKSLNSLFKIKDWDIYYISANIFDPTLKLIDENLLKIDGCYCVHAYIVNSKCFDRMLEYNPETDPPIDAWITQKMFNKYAGYPLICSQIDSISDNVGGLIGYDEIFTNVYNRQCKKFYES